jgi:hypothetical protein
MRRRVFIAASAALIAASTALSVAPVAASTVAATHTNAVRVYSTD